MLTLTQEWNGYDRILIIDEENNASVQLTIYKDEKITAFLHSLYVPKDKRKKGYGTRLMKQAENMTLYNGRKCIILQVEKQDSQETLQHFYEHLGYEKIKEDSEYIEMKKELK